MGFSKTELIFFLHRSGGSHALTFGGTSTRGDSLTTLTMKSSDHSDVGKDYRGGSSSTVGQDDPIPVFLRRLNDLNTRVGTRTRFLIELDDASGVQVNILFKKKKQYIYYKPCNLLTSLKYLQCLR